MRECLQFYIGGQWVDPVEARRSTVVNPATEQPSGVVALGSAADVDRAVAAAKAAFPAWSRTSREERIALLERIAEVYRGRLAEMAEAITAEMGAPAWLAQGAQAPLGINHMLSAAEILKSFRFDEDRGPH